MIGLAERLVGSNAGTGIGSSVVVSIAGSSSATLVVLLDFLENETGRGTGIFSILVFETIRRPGVDVTMLGVARSASVVGRVVTRVTTFLPDTDGLTGCLTAGRSSFSSVASPSVALSSSFDGAEVVVVTIRGACVTLVFVEPDVLAMN